jgi:hypothetical protein
MAAIAELSSANVPPAPVQPCSDESPELYRFCLARYERMGRLGVLTEDDRVELVEGVLCRKPTKRGPHSIASREAAAALARMIPVSLHTRLRSAASQ